MGGEKRIEPARRWQGDSNSASGGRAGVPRPKDAAPVTKFTPDAKTKRLIADAVHAIMTRAFPENHHSLCHAYAIVGSNVLSILSGRNYRPVAGLAILDAGGGRFVKLMDNAAFANDAGGAYHCWIYSGSEQPGAVELIDFSFRNNEAYARANGHRWDKPSLDYLWGRERDINVGGAPLPLPRKYAKGKAWFCETKDGSEWLDRHMASHVNAYANLTSMVLKYLAGIGIAAPPSGGSSD